jgi:hypothetical protein
MSESNSDPMHWYSKTLAVDAAIFSAAWAESEEMMIMGMMASFGLAAYTASGGKVPPEEWISRL